MSEIISISSNSLTASIDTMGAQLMSLRKGESEYLWQGDSNWWPRRAPILFPSVGVLKDGKADSAEGTVSLARHGLARLNQFEVVEKSDSTVTLQLKNTEETRKSYPYDFELKLIFSVDGDTLTQTYEVTNPGNVVLPFTLGAHPAFNIPVPGVEASSLDQYHLLFTRSWTSYGPSITDDGLCDYAHLRSLLWTLTHFLSLGSLLIARRPSHLKTSLIDVLHLQLTWKLRLRPMVFKWILKALIIWAFGVLLLVVHLLLLSHGVALQIPLIVTASLNTNQAS